MGLDMSLKIKRKPMRGRSPYGEHLVLRTYYQGRKEIGYDIPDFNTGKIKYNQYRMQKATRVEDTYFLADWRKANAIHKWFVDNVQDGNDNCKEYRVNQKQLEDLYELVCDVLEHCELKEGKVRNGYSFRKFLGIPYKKYNKVTGKVLSRKSRKYCAEHLPTQDGFFFGNTDYNEYYYNDLLYTKDRLEYILNHYNVDSAKIYYSSSW